MEGVYQREYRRTSKPRGSFLEQDLRRAEFLKRQQRDRQDILNQMRDIAGTLALADPATAGAAERANRAADETELEIIREDDNDMDVEEEEVDDTPRGHSPVPMGAEEQGEPDPEGDGETMAAAAKKKKQKAIRRFKASQKAHAYFADQLVIPDVLIDTPRDLCANWLVSARPEGNRAIVIASKGFATCRWKNGRFREHFAASGLPKGTTMLDCAFDEGQGVFWILDCLIWNNCMMVNASAETRFFFLASRCEEAGDTLSDSWASQKYAMKPVKYHPCTLHNALELYYEESLNEGYVKDSLMFIHKEARYIPGWNPLYLNFRDRHLSRYNVDTLDVEGSSIPEMQQSVLEFRRKGVLRTLDRVVVGHVDEATKKAHRLHRGALVRCEIGGVDLETRRLLNVRILGKASWSRAHAEPLSRILMQAMQREGFLQQAKKSSEGSVDVEQSERPPGLLVTFQSILDSIAMEDAGAGEMSVEAEGGGGAEREEGHCSALEGAAETAETVAEGMHVESDGHGDAEGEGEERAA